MAVKREEYNGKRAFALRLFGIFMLIMGLFSAIFSPLYTLAVQRHSTAVTKGVVTRAWEGTDDDGKTVRKINIYYKLEGEEEGGLVTKEDDALSVGDEVSVCYNPENTEEKYIEGFEESPLYYLGFGLLGAAVGVAALALSRAAKRNGAINDALDLIDR